MSKPRVIIADRDFNYIIPLKHRFVQEFYDKIELEIITDEGYFNALFANPQKADILIVSEEFYSLAIQKHDINFIYMMVEEMEDGLTGDLKVKRLFKYSSLKEIFNEIVSQSVGVFSTAVSEKKGTEIIVVTSGYGGAGKTSVSMGISACLTKNYKRVLYVNACRLNMFQFLLDNKTPIAQQDIYAKMIQPSQKIYADIKHVIRNEKFSYLPPLKAALLSLGIHESFYTSFVRAAQESKEYDYIIVDLESVFDEFAVSMLGIADRVIVVTEQTASAAFETNTYISNINGLNPEKYIFVCNKFKKDASNALLVQNSGLRFGITEYIDYFDHYGNVTCEELSGKPGIRKVAFLLV